MKAQWALVILGLSDAQIVSLGRELGFVPRDPEPAGMSRFWVLHAAYTSLEVLKLALGLLVAWLITRTASPAPGA